MRRSGFLLFGLLLGFAPGCEKERATVTKPEAAALIDDQLEEDAKEATAEDGKAPPTPGGDPTATPATEGGR